MKEGVTPDSFDKTSLTLEQICPNVEHLLSSIYGFLAISKVVQGHH